MCVLQRVCVLLVLYVSMCVLQRVFSVDSRSQGHSSPVRFCWQKAHGNYLATSGYSLQLLSNASKHVQCTYRNMSGRRTFLIILLRLNSHGYDVSLKQFADTDHGERLPNWYTAL